jgi:cell division protein FtsI/penicillin-binding protein 2
MPLRDCFAKSDNICLYHVAKEYLSTEEFHNYLVKFGIGQSTGIDLAGESYWPLKDAQYFNIGDIAAMSYGHGYLVNLVQAADAISAIANNGVRMKPYVVTKVIDSDGNVSEYKPQIIDTVISKETSDRMLEMMRYNFENSIYYGEWWYEDLKNYDLGVKSGTALIATQSGYSEEINASFIGFDQSPQRTFIMAIKLEKPQLPEGQNLSAYNVRPLWLDTFAAVKDIIGVPRK